MKKMSCKARAVPDSHTLGSTITNKIPQVGIKIECLDGILEGQIVTWYGFFTDKSEKRTLEQLHFAGWDKTNFAKLPGLGSTEFELQFEEEEERDENDHVTGSVWRPTFINRIGVAMKNKMSETEIRSFSARIDAMMRAEGGALAQGTRPAGRPAPRTPVTQGAQPARGAQGGQQAQREPGEDYGPDAPFTDEDAGVGF